MKKFFAIAAMALVTLVANAQTPDQGTFSITPKAGISYGGYLNTSYTSYTGKLETQGSIGFTVGAEASYMASSWFKPSIGLAYNSVTNTIKDDLGSFSQTNGYLAIPVLANFYVSNGWALKTGIQPAFLLSASIDGDDGKDSFKSTDFTIPVGTSYEFGNFMLDFTFYIGLTNTLKDDSESHTHTKFNKLSNGYGTFTIGYRLDLK